MEQQFVSMLASQMPGSKRVSCHSGDWSYGSIFLSGPCKGGGGLNPTEREGCGIFRPLT